MYTVSNVWQLTCGQHKIRFDHINSVTTELLEVWNAPGIVETTDMDVRNLHRGISMFRNQLIMRIHTGMFVVNRECWKSHIKLAYL